jgi:hypothetical protein
MKSRLIFTGVFLLLVILAHWVVLGEGSPLREYFLWHVAVPNVLRGLNAIPAIISAVISGNHGGGDRIIFFFLFAIQWSAVGFVLSSYLLPATKGPRPSYR